jgi:hypothetical protein
MFFVCRPTNPGFQGMRWFCDRPLLQFPFTVILPFVLLMVWQVGFCGAGADGGFAGFWGFRGLCC